MSIVPSPAVLRVWWLRSNMYAPRSVALASAVLAGGMVNKVPLFLAVVVHVTSKTTYDGLIINRK